MGHRSMQYYCKGGCYTEGLEEELDAEHKQRERGYLDGGSHRGIKLIDHVMKVLDEDNEMRDWCRTSKELRQISVWSV